MLGSFKLSPLTFFPQQSQLLDTFLFLFFIYRDKNAALAWCRCFLIFFPLKLFLGFFYYTKIYFFSLNSLRVMQFFFEPSRWTISDYFWDFIFPFTFIDKTHSFGGWSPLIRFYFLKFFTRNSRPDKQLFEYTLKTKM